MSNCHVCNAALPPDAEWCGQCLTPVKQEAHEPVDRPEPEPFVGPPPEYSAWKAGPYSFGPVGKILITAFVVLVGAALAYVSARIGSFYGTMGLALVMMLIGIFSVFAVMGLWGLWRPTRVK
jgi:hypothetical protein